MGSPTASKSTRNGERKSPSKECTPVQRSSTDRHAVLAHRGRGPARKEAGEEGGPAWLSAPRKPPAPPTARRGRTRLTSEGPDAALRALEGNADNDPVTHEDIRRVVGLQHDLDTAKTEKERELHRWGRRARHAGPAVEGLFKRWQEAEAEFEGSSKFFHDRRISRRYEAREFKDSLRPALEQEEESHEEALNSLYDRRDAAWRAFQSALEKVEKKERKMKREALWNKQNSSVMDDSDSEPDDEDDDLPPLPPPPPIPGSTRTPSVSRNDRRPPVLLGHVPSAHLRQSQRERSASARRASTDSGGHHWPLLNESGTQSARSSMDHF